MNGLLLVDKPTTWTSFDVVNKVRGIIADGQGVPRKKVKVGHSGTLDPLATGLLVLAIGSYTKRLQELTKQDKVYEATLALGATSTTEDAEGEIQARQNCVEPSKEQVDAVLNTFVGTQQQVPPIFSAIKINGQRAYKQARQGKEVKMEPRAVTVKSISSVTYEWPQLIFTVDVSSGTYIRSLARDIGESLEVGAYLSALRRVSIADFLVQDAVQMDGLNISLIQDSIISY